MHTPVLLQEVIAVLQPKSGTVYIDGTIGAGGHAAAILAASTPDGRLFGFDQDHNALKIAQNRLAEFGNRVHLLHSNFKQLSKMAHSHQIPLVDGILLDLGVSSMQFDQAQRGFSFQHDGPLDMRMNSSSSETAADLINALPEVELANLIYQYGEEHYSRRIAKAIVKVRPIQRTTDLARIVAKAIPSRSGKRGKRKIHPATRTFQALRIAVNDELTVLEQVLPQAIAQLKPAGRLAVITFHSLEDRIVKHYFKREAQDCICPPEQLICSCYHKAIVNIITKKPITPSLAEIDENPKARSAKLRVIGLKRE